MQDGAGVQSLVLLNHRSSELVPGAGECNAALAQQALVLREHMAQRDAETSALADELRRAQVVIAVTLCDVVQCCAHK